MPEPPLADVTTQRQLLPGAREIAAPGCNATGVSLALAPLARAALIDPAQLSSVLQVAYSGAGRSAKQHLLLAAGVGTAAPYAVRRTPPPSPYLLQNLRR